MVADNPTNLLDKASDWGFELFSALFVMVVGWVYNWKGNTDKAISDLKLDVANNYVKKSDMAELKQDIAAEFKDVKDSQTQILNLLLGQKIGTKPRG